MNFQNNIFLVPIIFLIIIIVWGILKIEKRYFNWIELYWFYKKSFSAKISSFMLIMGFSVMIIALLDLRGPEKRLEGKSFEQKTMIMIDSSGSMLAEDVRPNRFKKALLLVKHYMKKSVGQQISIVVFSDGSKRIVPFTEDLDLLEARINTLETLSLERGGTGLSLAIKESIQYFKTAQNDEPVGNLLIITDGEETEGKLELDIPDTISVGVIGIGTSKGAAIPDRDRYGTFKGYKKYQGQVVISKLDQKYLESLGEEIKYYKYWIATSYSLPTEEILNFFSTSQKIKESQDVYRVRPVWAHYILIPAFIFLLLGYFLRLIPTYTLVLFIVFLPMSIKANVEKPQAPTEQKEPTKSEETLLLEEKLKNNELDVEGRLKLGENLLKEGFSQEAETLYGEELDEVDSENIIDSFNYATALAKNNKVKESVAKYNEILKATDDEDFKKKIKQNITSLFKEQNQQGSEKNKKEDQQNNQSENDKKDGESQEGDQKDKKEDKQSQGEDKKKEEEKQEKGKNEKEKEEKDENKEKNQDREEQEKKKKKIPAIVKQLMNDDNQLQKKAIDAKTSIRKNQQRKDW